MIDFLKFIFIKRFLIHVILAILITGTGLWYVFKSLDDYTLHGQTITVPDFKGVKLAELDDFSKQHQLRYHIIDSVYQLDKPKGTVVEQNPAPESQVKDNRKIYLTVNALLPPKVKLPSLKDLTLRHATAIIESYNLTLGELIYEPGPCTNCVLRMEIDEKEVEPGMMVTKKTKVDLVLGQGASSEKVALPCLVGFTEMQARQYLRGKGLNIGATPYELCLTEEDSLSAQIYKQTPDCDTLAGINLGSTIDVFLTGDSTKWISSFSDTIAIGNPTVQ